MNPGQLNADVVGVKINGKYSYFDPAARYAPFGMVTWDETGVSGLQLDKEGGTWITTPLPESSESQIIRKGNFRLTDDGTLQGRLVITYSGLEALWRRIEERNEDDGSRKKYLEDQVKEYIPVGSDVELVGKPEWGNASATMTAEYDMKVPGWAAGAGKRVLLPSALFTNTEKHLFEHAERTHPIYFTFQFKKTDDITVELPLGWQATSFPKPVTLDSKVIVYSSKSEDEKGVLHLQRQLDMQLTSLEVKYYPALRTFFQNVRTADEQQIVVQPGVAGTGK